MPSGLTQTIQVVANENYRLIVDIQQLLQVDLTIDYQISSITYDTIGIKTIDFNTGNNTTIVLDFVHANLGSGGSITIDSANLKHKRW